jgi:hypothetical protein
VVVGDFVAELGQGLMLWRAAGLGKSADVTSAPVRAGRGIRTYSSSSEYGFLRGAGVTVAPARWLAATAFASRRHVDATIVDTGAAGRVATSLSADGLHRTADERARRGSLGETLVGASIEMRGAPAGADARLGLAAYTARFDIPLQPAQRPDTRHALQGTSHGMASLFGELRSGSAHAFGEIARGRYGPAAFIAGFGGSLGSRADFLVLGRRYPPRFVAPHGAPFGERGGPGQNEEGLYVAVHARPTPRWTVAWYLDAYRFPWLRFNVPRPSTGHEALIWTEFLPRRWIRLYAHGRTEIVDAATSSANLAGGSAVGALYARARASARLQADLNAGRTLLLRARFELVRARTQTAVHLGSLLFQDIRWTPHPAMRVDARITLFSADDFGARLYQLESDVAGSFTMPALHGTGARSYLSVSAAPFADLTVRGRVGVTYLEDTNRQGSGPDAVPGNRQAEVSMQVRWRFRAQD